jgi:hypothetical protein
MQYIDTFCHYFPPRAFELLLTTASVPAGLEARNATAGIHDLEARFRMMDLFEYYGDALQWLDRALFDYFREFYADTALCGSYAATTCGLSFFGADQTVFATDAPFGPDEGAAFVRSTVEAIMFLDISGDQKAQIVYGNAEKVYSLQSDRTFMSDLLQTQRPPLTQVSS